jgi:hypothetical protein
VYVVWVDEKKTTGDSNIELIRSNDTGKGFSNRITLRAGDHLSYSPQITATEKGDVYVVWVDKNSTIGDSDITFRSSNDRGRDFERAINLNKGEKKLYNDSSPQIVTTAKDMVNVVWVNNHVEFKEISVQDALVGKTIVLSNNTAWSSSPQITAAEKGDVYVVWVDNNSSTNASLQFKRISENYFDRNS